MATKSSSAPSPEEQPLTKARARWLAEETGIPLEDLADKRLGDVHDLIRPVFDPHLLFFRKVCGRVVKRDPLTGEDFGVPNATVHVEDTDFSLFSYYPLGHPYWWAWPFGVTREEIAHVQTDACGHFCVWVPRWDIDRILRLRRKLVCEPFPPRFTDLIDPPFIQKWPPGPIDPERLGDLPPDVLHRVQDEIGPEVAGRLAPLTHPEALAAGGDAYLQLMGAPAFAAAPPAPPLERKTYKKLRKFEHPGLEEAKLRGMESFDPQGFIGPFLRCHSEWVLEWQTVVDVPDITFRVTQDVDGDGEEETIYSEGFFELRWDAGEIPDVTLHAAPIALASSFCGAPGEARECKEKPQFYAVGPMSLDAAYHDSEHGYALRVNRPRANGSYGYPAESPYAEQLALTACHRLPGATYQRVMYRADGSSKKVPLFVPTWYAPTRPGQPTPTVPFSQDPEGWIEIRPAETLAFPDWVLHWPTPLEGRYFLHVECKDGSGAIVGSPGDEVAFTVDNVPCQLTLGPIRWREVGSGSGWSPLGEPCPVIRRKPGAGIELEVPWTADSRYFRNAGLSFSGCGNATIEMLSSSGYGEWYSSNSDTHGEGVALYRLVAGSPDGAYTLSLAATTRGFHPETDAGPEYDFYYDQSEINNYLWRAIAIVAEC